MLKEEFQVAVGAKIRKGRKVSRRTRQDRLGLAEKKKGSPSLAHFGP